MLRHGTRNEISFLLFWSSICTIILSANTLTGDVAAPLICPISTSFTWIIMKIDGCSLLFPDRLFLGTFATSLEEDTSHTYKIVLLIRGKCIIRPNASKSSRKVERNIHNVNQVCKNDGELNLICSLLVYPSSETYSKHSQISLHQNKKALSPFYHIKYFW